MKNLFIPSLLLFFFIIGCSKKTTNTSKAPVFDCGSFTITKIGEMKDSVKIIVDISACIDGFQIPGPGSVLFVWDYQHSLISKHITDAKGHVELNLPAVRAYAFESRAFPYKGIETAANRYDPGVYYINMKVSNPDALH